MLDWLQNSLRPAVWCIAGILLVFAEAIVPGFIIFFFGLAALLVGLLLFAVPDLSLTVVLALYLALSLGLLFGCRALFPETFRGRRSRTVTGLLRDPAKGKKRPDNVAGARAFVRTPIRPGSEGRVDFRGSEWNAVSDEDLPVGAEVEIVSRNNITLTVRKVTR